MRENMKAVSQQQASHLLHNKFVVVLGDSIQRSVYKDIVLLLQKDKYLSLAQLKTKGEMSFEQDVLVEGGRLGQMSNGTEYREVRQFRSDHHLVRFYFLTRIYSRYMQSILRDFEDGLKPDVVIVNSCVWDVSRYNPSHGCGGFNGVFKDSNHFSGGSDKVRRRVYHPLRNERFIQYHVTAENADHCASICLPTFLLPNHRYNLTWHVEYKENLHNFFEKMNAILPPECLVIWNMTMPLGKRIVGGFFVPEIEQRGPTLRYDVIHANFYSSKMADAYGLDVLDLHFQFRFSLEHRMKDGVHWNSLAHRRITTLLLQHAAEAWGVVLHCAATAVEQQQFKANIMMKNTVIHNWCYPPEPHFRRPDPRMMNPGHCSVAWATERFGHYDGYEPQANYFTPNLSAIGWHPAEDSGLEPYRPLEGEYNGCGEQFYEDHPKFGAGYFSFEENQANRPSLVNRQPTAPVHRRHTQVVNNRQTAVYRHPPVRHSLDNGMAQNRTGHYSLVEHNEAYHPRPYFPLPPPPAWPENQYVLRKKQPKKHYAPYTCQRPHQYHRY